MNQFRPSLSQFACLTAAIGLWIWAWNPLLATFDGDNAVYWFTANAYSPWSEASPTAVHFAQNSIYPPLYPLVLALLGGGESILVAHLISAAMLAVTLPLAGKLARTISASPGIALAVVASFLGARITLLEAIQLHSEHLFVLLSMLALVAARYSAESRRALWLAAICVGLACLTRSFALALLLAFLGWLLMERPRGWFAAALLAATPALGWHWFGSGNDLYLANLARLYNEAGPLARLTTNLEWLARKWTWCFAEPGHAGFQPVLAILIAVVACAGAAMRAIRRQLDGFYVLAALSLIALWPYPAEYERLLFPLLPVLFVQAAWFVQRCTPHHTHGFAQHAGPVLLFTLLLACEIPFLILFAGRLSASSDDAGYRPYQHMVAWYYANPETTALTIGYQRGIVEALDNIREQELVPAGDCILAIKPSITALYSGRIVHGMPLPGAPAALLKTLRSSPCKYLFMTLAHSPTFPEAYYPYNRVADTLEVIAAYRNPADARAPAAIFARLR